MTSQQTHAPALKTQISTLQTTLAHAIAGRTSGDEDRCTEIPDLLFFRREKLTEPCACMVEPSVVFVAQGAKQMLVGDEAFPYDPEHFLINSIDLPASSQVIEASPEKPCVGLVLKLDLSILAALIAQGGLTPPTERPADRGLARGSLSPQLLEPFQRLLALLDEPASIPVLAPLILREIHYRLLMSDQAARLWQIVSLGSQSQRIAKAIDWLKAHYTEPLRIEELAARIQMSTSSLHFHFRQLTAMSPLQYQKWLRLNEARRLMLNEHLDAASAAFHVGYESPSQFSREYSRLFGAPPKRDIEDLRHGRAGARKMSEATNSIPA
ncbi:AraC family transcriptional regulator [Uliginosibacterium aquaticum]|uniref:AraC family transcriptional regulator n=1 Tax=Uliginosibacterium aquaticum TaxID=2731212 RepID=A0ABX2IE65_9RHOO|nr:AraC family transcriptional regulator [Uliginosibacterium aquaticum]NSL54934.1 AraC family transcriptional regulator [Uliginosibacterium aquaticum]